MTFTDWELQKELSAKVMVHIIGKVSNEFKKFTTRDEILIQFFVDFEYNFLVIEKNQV